MRNVYGLEWLLTDESQDPSIWRLPTVAQLFDFLNQSDLAEVVSDMADELMQTHMTVRVIGDRLIGVGVCQAQLMNAAISHLMAPLWRNN